MQLSSQQGVRILHVDDDPSITDLTGTFLEREDERFTVETATSADEGLESINDRPPDCVVSDYNMPGIGGIEFLQAVREEHPDLPFILYTGKGSEEVASEAISAGVTDYLQKKSGTEQYELLANRIENAVQSRRKAEQAEWQEQLMRLTEFAGDTGGFELDADTGDVLMTDGTRRILHLPDQANPDFEKNLQHYHPDDREEIKQAIQRALQTGEQTQGIFRYQHPDAEEQQLLDITYTPTTVDGDTTAIRGAIHDVTDRRERQQELQLLQQAIDYANVPITLADPSKEDDPLVYVNDGFEEMTGYPPEETLGRNCRFLQGEDTDPKKVAALREAIDNEETISVELRNYRKDGTEFWNRLTVTPIYDDDGNLVRYLGTQQDITERKEHEQKLDLIEMLFEYAEECQFIVDVADGEFELRHANQYYKRTVGLPADTPVTGQTPVELFGETGGQQILDRYRRCVETQNSVSYTVELPVPEEGTVYRTILTPATTDGEVTHIVGTARDITDRMERQQELEEYRTIVEALADAVYVIDEDGQFAHVNDEFVELVGYNRETIIGSTPSLIKDDDAVEQAERQLGRLLSSDGPDTVTFEVEIQPREGDPIVCEDHMGTLPFDGEEFEGSVGVLRDITEHKEYEQGLEAQNERLEEFTGIVSHDLQSPLGVAEGHLELAEATGEREHLAKATEAVERSQALIDDLLALARGGNRVGETAPVDIAKIAESSWQTVETQQATLDADESGLIEANRSRLQELFENLYRNAIEHGGDDVTVSVGAMDDGFYITDTGPGIPESNREDVFEAGYSTNEDGTGFGLRIVRQIAEAHGWEITVTESEDGGARFEITGVETGA
jgi:PAS domain S-box-containing protein